MKFCPYCGAYPCRRRRLFLRRVTVNKSQYMGQKAHPRLRFGNIAL